MNTIGVAMIVKNEKEMLARCLESLKGVDEIFIADTGSTDNTVEIAKQYTKNVFTDFKWCDNFALARNFIKSKVTSDWILSIDADEVLYDFSAVREAVVLAEERKGLAVDCTLIAEDNGQTFYYPRLFKNSPQVFWEGSIHNTLSVRGEKLGNVRIKVGYSPAHRNDPERAFRILKRDVEERYSPRSMFYLGREYWYRKEYENCVTVFGKYVQTDDKFLAQKADAFLIMAMAFFAMGMGEDARDSCIQAIKINATFKEAILFMAKIVGDGRGNEAWQANADQWKKMAETATNRDVLFIRTDYA